MKKEVYYPEYLKLDVLLNAQHRESEKKGSPAHDEMLFIITHQTLELWMKQIHFELDDILDVFAQPFVKEESLSVIHQRLLRIDKIQHLMINHFDVLETMTPLDFLDFRDDLIPASGFQSLQFKLLEKKLGATSGHSQKLREYSKQSLQKEDQEKLTLDTVTLFQGVKKWLERNPFLQFNDYTFEQAYKQSVEDMFHQEIEMIEKHPHLTQEQKEKEKQNSQKLLSSFQDIFSDDKESGVTAFGKKATLSALFIHLYRDQPMLHTPYQVLRALLQIDVNHTQWKQRHLSMVQKMIGMKMGTGGSSGQKYLHSSIDASRIFPDLVTIPSYLIPRKNIAPLPDDIAKHMGFQWV